MVCRVLGLGQVVVTVLGEVELVVFKAAKIFAVSTILRLGIRIGLRNEKRRDVAAAIVVRHQSFRVVARVYEIPQRTICDWRASHRTGVWDALKEGRRSGRPRKVSAQAMKWTYNAVTLGKPQQYQCECGL